MKKRRIIAFLCMAIVIILAYKETKGFTYLNGKLSDDMTFSSYAISGIAILFGLLYVFSDKLKPILFKNVK
jgi:predicted MFS family arabinose efflux permease